MVNSKNIEGGTRGVNRGWPSICIWGLRKSTKNTQSGQWVFETRLNPWPPDNETKVLHLQLWWCLLCFFSCISMHVQKILVDLWWHVKDGLLRSLQTSFQKLFPCVVINFLLRFCLHMELYCDPDISEEHAFLSSGLKGVRIGQVWSSQPPGRGNG